MARKFFVGGNFK
ncbi:hypothetical protein FDECE_17754, partial [Fusarium decemcellulare]